MDMSQADEEERQARIKQELELRAKKRNSRLFLFFGSVFEIVETLLVITALFVFFSFLIFKVFSLPENAAKTIFQGATIIAFIGGLFLGFMIYRTCANFVIVKFKLHDKLTNEVLGHYSKRVRNAEKEALKK